MNYKTQNKILLNITKDILGSLKFGIKTGTYSRILDSCECLR